MNWRWGKGWLGAIALGLWVGVLAACGGGSELGQGEAGVEGETIPDQGDFVLVYEEPSSSELLPVYEALLESEFYDGIVDEAFRLISQNSGWTNSALWPCSGYPLHGLRL